MGTRSSVYAPDDFDIDASLGFVSFDCRSFDSEGVPAIMDRLRARLADRVPVYVSIDIDVLDPAHAPGTGTPEASSLTSRELLAALRGLDGLNLVGADIVEVAPGSDHAELTGIAAANIGYELLSVMALSSAEGQQDPCDGITGRWMRQVPRRTGDKCAAWPRCPGSRASATR